MSWYVAPDSLGNLYRWNCWGRELDRIWSGGLDCLWIKSEHRNVLACDHDTDSNAFYNDWCAVLYEYIGSYKVEDLLAVYSAVLSSCIYEEEGHKATEKGDEVSVGKDGKAAETCNEVYAGKCQPDAKDDHRVSHRLFCGAFDHGTFFAGLWCL